MWHNLVLILGRFQVLASSFSHGFSSASGRHKSRQQSRSAYREPIIPRLQKLTRTGRHDAMAASGQVALPCFAWLAHRLGQWWIGWLTDLTAGWSTASPGWWWPRLFPPVPACIILACLRREIRLATASHRTKDGTAWCQS